MPGFRTLALSLLAVLWGETSVAGGIVADGSTATTVNVRSDGSVQVGIAAPNGSGVSLNRYERFSVTSAGAEFNNRSARARTIVTEVTGKEPTAIAGPVTVAGQRAHLLFANPNGISVDGGAFVNTGQVVLGAGTVSNRSREIAPGIWQDNVVLTTAPGGAITVSGGGLSGEMEALHLYAERIRVTGQVTDTSADALSFVRAVAGPSSVEFDSAIVPGNLGHPWAQVGGNGTKGSGGTVFELGAAGGINGNSVEVLVTDAGAGVRLAGQGLAGSGHFTVDSTGNIVLDGGSVSGATGVALHAASFSGQTTQVNGNQGTVAIAASGGAGILLSDTKIAGADIAVTSAGGFSLGGRSPEMVSVAGDIAVDAAGTISDTNGGWQSAANIRLTAGTELSFSGSTLVAADVSGIGLVATDAVRFADSILAAGTVAATGSQLSFSSADRAGSVVARDGGLRLAATRGDIDNDSTLLEGESGVVLTAAGSYRATSRDATHRAIVYTGAGDVSVTASSGDIDSRDSRIIANGNVSLTAAKTLRNDLTLADGSNDLRVSATRESHPIWWSLGILRHSTSSLDYSYGEPVFSGQDALILASGGDVTIRAGRVESLGGDITANATADGTSGGQLDIAAGSVALGGVGLGSVSVRSDCNPFCRYEISEGEDGAGITVQGGQLYGEAGLSAAVAGKLTSRGGLIASQGDVAISAGDVSLAGVVIPYVVERPGGLYNFWRSRAGWIYLRREYGGIVSDGAALRIDSPNPVFLDATTLSARGDVSIPNGVTRSPASGIVSPVGKQTIGILADLAPVEWE